VSVAAWSWPYIEHHIRGLHPNAPLFPSLDRWTARDAHADACKSLGFLNYRQHDQRHSYAVRQARAGTSAELIAHQLGHSNAVMVLKIYGRFLPSQQDRDK
jgi:integrase